MIPSPRALRSAAFGVLVAAAAAAGVRCGGAQSTPSTEICSGVSATSTQTNGHAHELCVPARDITTPPAAGATYTTSMANGHDHTVTLTAIQLRAIREGEGVTVVTSVTQDHTHQFTIAKPNLASSSSSSGGGGTSSGSGTGPSGVSPF